MGAVIVRPDANSEKHVKAFLNHINDLDRKLSSAQFNIDQLNVGRQKFVELLADSLENPEETEVVN